MAVDLGISTTADGGVVVDLNVGRRSDTAKKKSGKDFNQNLVEILDQAAINTIEQQVHEGIDADIQSRQSWVANYNEGLKLLGLLLEKPEQLNNNTSTVRHPLLAWAIIQFQALSNGEMLPAAGPVKVKNDGPLRAEVAEALERDLNHYLTAQAEEYYPDTDRGLYYLGYGGTIFKKIYRCPLRNRPVSECVYLPDLILSNDTVVLSQARRVTHQIEGFSKNRIIQMQEAGWWADVAITPPVVNPSSTLAATAQATGIDVSPVLPRDQTHTIYECHTWLDLEQFGVEDEFAKKKAPGLEVPYVVTLDKDTRAVYAIRRNWREKTGNWNFPKRRFVKWGMIPGIGYLDQGFLNLLGNTELAVTALLRILVDAGIYSIFPAGVRKKGMRMDTNEIRPAPGQFPEIDTGDLPIGQAIMPLPFKGPAAENLSLLQHLEGLGEKMAGISQINTKEGVKDVPVGTMMAAIEQSAQVQIAVHKRLHNAQKLELMALRDEFEDMGEEGLAILKQRNPESPYTAEELYSASLVPASDPEMPAHIYRFMQATALEALYTAHPEMYNGFEVQRRILEMARINNINEILIPPDPNAQAQPDPMMMAAMEQIKLAQQDLQIKAETEQGKLQIEQLKVQIEKWVEEQKLALQREKQEAELSAKTASDQEDREAELDRKTLEAAEQEEARRQEAQTKQTETEMKIESAEKIAAMKDQTTLIVEGIRADQAPTTDNPVRDDKAGP